MAEYNSNPKTGEKRGRNSPMTYRKFFQNELKRIKLEDSSISHKDAFKQAGLNWRTSPLNPKNQAAPALTGSVDANSSSISSAVPTVPPSKVEVANSSDPVSAKEQQQDTNTPVSAKKQQQNTNAPVAEKKPAEALSIVPSIASPPGYKEPPPSASADTKAKEQEPVATAIPTITSSTIAGGINNDGSSTKASLSAMPLESMSEPTPSSVEPNNIAKPANIGFSLLSSNNDNTCFTDDRKESVERKDSNKANDTTDSSGNKNVPVGKMSSMVAHTVPSALTTAK
ncbi:hypothetical protein GGI25_000447 [Coemansia spiralis]|uniref:YABBY protein C-terminal domain-containing protein n=2 Tax=Coemansia TaxID=4863 RepID=A0A9W8G7M5_9FUNG|nr:hypothetical protein EDC05_000274 [Coemansia umbellata]KAJ2624153.1 hypothetical protein GGI26_001728 [Coemansia sp. RSA 1358]KAJ2680811.1 hypothetical protein GGI25_000447 [Coemansia spiralis]